MKTMNSTKTMVRWSLVAALALAAVAQASERRFTYTYDSGVLGTDARELELWTTMRAGRDTLYRRFDQRMEFEWGLTDRLQTAFYLNFGGLTRRSDAGLETSFDFKGISNEWKYKLLDPVADPVGLALYGEFGAGPTEVEAEAKIIIDKRFDKLFMALNLVGEYEWELEGDELERELALEVDAGIGYLLTPSFSMGLELRSHTEVVGGVAEHTVLFLGPSLSYATHGGFATLTLLPQLTALGGATHGGLNLDEHERIEARLLFGWHL